jgi:hypothetical protein
VFQHLPAEVSSNRHQGVLAGLPLRKFGNARVAKIMEAEAGNRAFNFVNVGQAFLVLARLARILELPTRGALN